MAKDPAFLFYTSDFLTGTMFMTMEEKGIYITLLCVQHQHGGLIDKDNFNAVTKDHPIVCKKFVETNEGFYNKRCVEEAEKRANYSKSRSDNRLNKKDMKKTCKTYVKHMENENEDVNEDEKRDEKELYAELVRMTTDQYDRLLRKFGKFHLEKAIFILNNYKHTKGKKYKSDYHALLSWAIDESIKKFPAAAQQDGKKDERFNREGLKKLNDITKGVFKQ